MDNTLEVDSSLQPPLDTNSATVNDQHVQPFSAADSNIDPVITESHLPGSSIAPHCLTPPSGDAMKEHVLKVREPPLVAQSNIPVTCIIPPTPINATSFVDSDDHASVETLLLGQSEPSTSSSGHRTAAINNILDEGYNNLEDILMQLINKTAFSPQQIMDGWH